MNAPTHVFKRVRTLDLHADVYHPDTTSRPPAILWLHGGALIFGSRHDLSGAWSDHVHRYLAAGLAVVAIDYRLAPETKLDEIIADVRDAYHWLRTTGPDLLCIDPDRIARECHHGSGAARDGVSRRAAGDTFHLRRGSMKVQRIAVALGSINLVLLLGLLLQGTPVTAEAVPSVVRAQTIELVDAHGRVRASLEVETNLHMLAKRTGTSLTLNGKDGKQRIITP